MVLDLAGWFISERFTNKPRRPTESKRKKNGEKRAKRTKKGDDFPENEQNVDGRKKEKNSKHQSDDVTGTGQGIDPEVSAVGALLAGIEHSLILENGSGDLQILIANHDTYRPTVRGVPFSTVREREGERDRQREKERERDRKRVGRRRKVKKEREISG